MRTIPVFLALLAALLCAGCSKSGADSAAGHAGAYPSAAAAVTGDPAYRMVFTSEETGISYYLRRLAPGEAAGMPEDFVITGEKASVLFVPVKDGKIVDAPMGDRMALGYKVPEDMLQ